MFVRFLLPPDDLSIQAPGLATMLGCVRRAQREGPELKAMADVATAVIKDVYAGSGSGADTVREQVRVTLAIRALLPWLMDDVDDHPEDLDFTLRCAIAHHRLPDAQRLAREARIAAVFDHVFADPWLRAKMAALEQPIKRMAVLIPDPMVPLMVRDHAVLAFVGQYRQDEAVHRHVLGDVHEALLAHKAALEAVTPGISACARDFLMIAFLGTEPGGRPALAQLAKAMLASQRGDELGDTFVCMQQNQTDYPFLLLLPHMIEMLRARSVLHPGDEAGMEELTNFVVEQALKELNTLKWQVADVSINAVLDGVPLGKAYTDAVLHRLAHRLVRLAEAENTISVADLRPAPLPTIEVAQQAAGDVTPPHSWSVNRLLAWIEGPITERTATRQAVRQRRQQQQQAGQTPANRAGRARPGSVVPEDIAEGEIDLVVTTALQATADFQLRDLDDLLRLADALRLPATAINPCRQAREAMQRIASGQGMLDDNAVCQALARAETAITALRAQVKRTQIEAGRRRRFITALDRALNAEPLVRGKRHGGVIDCALPRDQWGWVNAEFNGQWIAGAQQLEINGQPVPLRSNEALALYVTGTSLSGHAFDISVHLWQRRGGHSGPPCADATGPRLMNRDDWFDTHVPCAVLHVPLGQ